MDEHPVGHCGCIEHADFQEGNWPLPCRSEITVSYAIDQIDRGLWERSLRRALKLWEDAIDVRFVILPHFTKDARIWITDSALPGSTLAWSFLANNSCGARLEQRYDTLVDWTEDYLTATIVHEVGHALGLTHSEDRDDVMFPSITMNTIGPSAGDVRRAVNIGYRKRISPLPDPDPPAPEPEPEPPPKPPKGPNMDWIEIAEILLKFIKSCQEKNGSEAAVKVLRQKGIRARWLTRVALREAGLKGKQLREAVGYAMEELAELNDDAIARLVTEAVEA